MRVIRNQNLYQLTVLPSVFPVNCYIYEEEDQLTLIDAGIPSSFNGIVKLVNEIGKPLTNVVLTHGHGDHVGALDKVKQAFPDVAVSISERDSRLLRGDVSLNSDEPQTPIKGGVPKRIKTIAERKLNEGDRIGSLEVVTTPGHTPGSISLFDTKNRAIIVGDAFQTRGKIAVGGQLVRSFPFPAFATWHKEIALASAKKILALDPTLLAVGHGNMIEDPHQQIEKAIREAAEQLGNVQKGA
ncbi:MBL fold metallo-hydrolase [Ornithinibacillus contaminans]|uniref:MBL fold metallo-hydrolase n=1 Tax=Ornithinibacillus contaminans TaxID=694055 RepID=UPI00064D9F22|nr:MBL fold metallo-hydrolase [Ornithinibacillus contaminans]